MRRRPHTIAIVVSLLTFNIIPLVGCGDSADDVSSNHDYPVKVLVVNQSSVIARRARDSIVFADIYTKHFQMELDGHDQYTHAYSVFKDLSSEEERYYIAILNSGSAPNAAVCKLGSVGAADIVLLDLTFETVHLVNTTDRVARLINEDAQARGSSANVAVDSNGNAVASVSFEELMDLELRVLNDGLCDRLTEEALAIQQ